MDQNILKPYLLIGVITPTETLFNKWMSIQSGDQRDQGDEQPAAFHFQTRKYHRISEFNHIVGMIFDAVEIGYESHKVDESVRKNALDRIKTMPENSRELMLIDAWMVISQRAAPAQVIIESLRLKEDLLMDSLDVAAVCVDLEDYYNIRIKDDHFEGWKNLSDILDTLQNYNASW